jgi:protein TonB
MKSILAILLWSISLPSFAQTTDPTGKQDTTTYAQKDCEITATFPGGEMAWKRFVDHNMRDPEKLFDKTIVAVLFRVDKSANTSDIQATSGPTTDGYREEAVRLIKKSGKWVPAIVNGRQVNAWKTVNIEFPPRQP